MVYPLYFQEIKLIINKIEKLESEFIFCTTVKNYKERLQVESELGKCYRSLMNSVKKEGLSRIWVEHDVLQFMFDHSLHTGK